MNTALSRVSSIFAALACLPSVPEDAEFGRDRSRSNMHDGFGYDFGADGTLLNTPNNMQRALAEKAETRRRERILNPNDGSTAKIQRYVFAVSTVLTLATPSTWVTMTGKPRTQFRPQRITSNAPFQGFAKFTNMQVANVGILVGGSVDAFDFCPSGGDQELDVPTLGPQNEVSIDGSYSGLVNAVAPFVTGSFELTVSFKGPATMAGG